MSLRPLAPLCALVLGLWLLLPPTLRAATETLRIGTVAWAGFAPVHVAAKQGFWLKQGLTVEVVVYSSNQDLNAALEAEKVDLALDMIGSWVGLHQAGVPLVIVGETDWSNGGDRIIVRADFNLDHLAGQRIGIYLDQPSVAFFLHRYLTTRNLRLSDVDLIELPPTSLTDAFVSSRFPMIVNYVPQATRAEREGLGKVVATSASFPGIIPEGFASLRSKWSQFSPETKLIFWKGWIKAVAWTREPENWSAYQAILNESVYPEEREFTSDELRALVGAVSLHHPSLLAERNRADGALEQYLRDLHSFLKGTGKLHREFTPAQLLSTEELVTAASTGLSTR